MQLCIIYCIQDFDGFILSSDSCLTLECFECSSLFRWNLYINQIFCIAIENQRYDHSILSDKNVELICSEKLEDT